MSNPILTDETVEAFNAALANAGSTAQVQLSPREQHRHHLELWGEDSDFLDYLPVSATPEMAAFAYRLYGLGLNYGMRAGEEVAWSKLRKLIGAAPHADQR